MSFDKKTMTLLLLFLLAFGSTFFSIHIRIKTTLIGYEIGRLKDLEAKLLKENSLLAVELAKVKSKKWLLNFLKREQKNEGRF